MLRITTFALAVCLLAVATASADIPLPKNLKYVDPRVRFEGIDKYADHVFYLRFLTFTAAPTRDCRLIEIKNADAFNLKAQRRLGGMALLAIERKDFDKRAKDDPSLKWLTDKADGVKAALLNAPSTVGKASDKEVPVTTYRVAIKDGKLSAEMVKPLKTSEAAPPTGLLPTWAFGLVSALSLTGLGIWVGRRRRGSAK